MSEVEYFAVMRDLKASCHYAPTLAAADKKNGNVLYCIWLYVAAAVSLCLAPLEQTFSVCVCV